MKISDALLPEFDHEMANTRKTLERVPEEKFGWKPHPKSWEMVKLATHLATIVSWTVETMTKEALDIGGASPNQPVASKKELLDTFDKHVPSARTLLAGASDEDFLKPWSLLMSGKMILTLPRVAVYRQFVMSHTIHHRAQLGVYLRLNDVPVPAIYGPSADGGTMGG
jgi:uncharacterized damage-inducible protein DinB